MPELNFPPFMAKMSFTQADQSPESIGQAVQGHEPPCSYWVPQEFMWKHKLEEVFVFPQEHLYFMNCLGTFVIVNLCCVCTLYISFVSLSLYYVLNSLFETFVSCGAHL